jgi:hypothetical protein
LTRLFRGEQDKNAKDGLAVAIANTADDTVIDEVIALARDPSHGTTRVLLLSALERSEDPRARAALMELGTDPDLKKQIPISLRRANKHRRQREKQQDR